MRRGTPKKSKKKALPYAVLASLVFSNIAMPYVQIGGVEFGTNVASAATTKTIISEDLQNGEAVQIGATTFYFLGDDRLIATSSIGQRRFDDKYSDWGENPNRSSGDKRSELNKYLNEEWRFTALGEDGTKQSPVNGEVDLLTKNEYNTYQGTVAIPKNGDGKYYWLKDVYNTEGVSVILASGGTSWYKVTNSGDVRPTIKLKKGITLIGSGTLTDPYKPVMEANKKPTLTITSPLNPKVSVGQDLFIAGTANDEDNDPMFVSTTIGKYTTRASVVHGEWILKIPAYALAEGQYPNVQIKVRDANGGTSVVSLGTVSVSYQKTIRSEDLHQGEVVQIGATRFYFLGDKRLIAISSIGQRRFDDKYSDWGENPKRSGGDTRSELNKYLNEEWRFRALGEDGTKQSPVNGEVDLLTEAEYNTYRGTVAIPQNGDGNKYWLKDPYNAGAVRAINANSTGGVTSYNANDTSVDVRPTVTLKQGITLTGSGTVDEPYVPIMSANNKPTLGITSGLNPKVSTDQDLVITGTASDKDNDPLVVSTTISGYTARASVKNGIWTLKIPAYSIPAGEYPSVEVKVRDANGATYSVKISKLTVIAGLPAKIETTPVETTKNKVKFSFKTVSGIPSYRVSSPNGVYMYTRDQSDPSKFNVVLDSSQKVASLADTKLFTPRVLSTASMPPVYMDSDGWVPFEDKGLEPETKYDYTITAQDSSGNTSGNTPINATTQPPTYIYLSWPPHPDAVKYRIKRNGETVWEGTETRGKDIITQDDMDVSSFEYTMWGVRSDGTEFELPMFEIIEKPYIDVDETYKLDLLADPERILNPVLRTEAGEEIPDATYSYTVKSGGQFISVDQRGKVKGLAVGEGVVTISSVAGDKTFTRDVTFKVIDTSDEIDSVTASVDNDKLSLLSDPTEQIKVEVKNKAGKVLTGLPVTYTVTKGTEVVSVDKNGLITAKAVGDATITVECAGKKANVNVTVQDLSSFSLNVDRTILNLRDAKTSKIDVILKDMDGNEIPNPTATYKVASGSDVVSVDQNGWVTAKAVGSALVEVTVGNETQSVAYTVEDLGSISVSAENTSLNLTDHQTEQLFVEVKDEAGNIVENPKVTYGISSGSGTVTVDDTGLVRAVAKGTSVIEVRYGSKTATISFTVEVEEPPVEEDLSEITVRANNPSLNLTDHTTEQLIVEVKDTKGKIIENPVVDYKVESGTEVVSVDAQGLVKAKAEGTATIVVSSGKKSARIIMNVNQPDLSEFRLKANHTTLNLTDNTTAQLVPELKDSTGNIIVNPPVRYTIKSGSDVVSVDANGLVTAKTVGTAVIEGSSGGKTASVTFTVQPPSDESSISVKAMNPSLNLTDHKTEQLLVEVKDKAGNVISKPNVVFTVVSGEDVLSVDQNGLVTAKAVGSATVQAESNGMRGTVSLTVSEPPVVGKSSISVSADNPTLDLVKHRTEQLIVVVKDKTGEVVPNPKVTYTVKSGEAIVSVDANGLVTAKAVGSAVIEATSGGLSSTITLNVQPQPPSQLEIKLKWKAAPNLLYYRVTRNGQEIYKGKNNYCVDYVQAGSVNDYKIYAHRLDGTTEIIDPEIEDDNGQKLNINLSNLIPSKGTLLAPFNKTVTDYSVTVDSDVNTINFIPIVEDKSSTVEINGIVTENNMASNPISVSHGMNEIAVDVISKDQKLRKRYTVNVLRQDGIPVTGIKLDKDKLLFDLNNLTNQTEGIDLVKRLNAIVMPDNATYKDVIWSTGNEAVATVDQNGNVRATGKGTTTITARTVDGNKTATATVDVGEGPILTYKSAMNFSVKKDQLYTLAGSVVGEGPITVYIQYENNQPIKFSEAVDSFPFSQSIKFDGSRLIAPNGTVAEGLSPGQTVTLKLWAEDSFGRKSRLANK